MKVLVFGEQFHSPAFYRRWELFANSYPDMDLTLLTPSVIVRNNKKSFGFGEEKVEGHEIDRVNFHIRTIERNTRLVGWTSPDFKRIIQELKPDVFYVNGEQHALHVVQILRCRKKYCPNMRVVCFGMRGPAYNLEMWKAKVAPFSRYLRRRLIFYNYAKMAVKYFNMNVDAVLCHYPRAVECYKTDGYKGPIYMQTQVGVNPELFHENSEWRNEIRNKYNLGDSYVFGSGTRFVFEKGVDDIIASLPVDGDWKYLIVGWGKPDEVERVKDCIKKRKLEGKIIMTGEIDFAEMPKYWNAIDCVVHVPRSSVQWEETFSIALVQAMITGKPIIASNSGSVPYQVGPEAMLVPAGDIDAIREKMCWVMSHQEEAKAIGEKMRQRAYNCFSIRHLNELLYKTLKEDIIPGKFDPAKADMATYSTEENYEKQKKDYQ